MSGAYAFTIVTRDHLPHAHVLMKSITTHWPQAHRVVFVVDSSEASAAPSRGAFEVISLESLRIDGYRRMAFYYDATALCCVLKPFAALHVLTALQAASAVYFDADMYLFRHPTELLEMLMQRPIVLTPHSLAPLPTNRKFTDKALMHVGGFNAGLIGVSPHPESQSFLQWWRDRLRLPGHAAIEWGYDQAWLDLVPILFPSLGILRDAGYNVAYWNLSDRPLRQEQTGVLYAGDAPLTLFHFSMFNVRAPADQREVTRRSDVEITPLVAEIVRAYAKRLEAANASSCRTMGYGYSVFSNGSPITARQRSCFAAQAVESAFLDEDPFDVRVALKRLKGLDRLRVASPFVARLVRSIRERAASIIGPGDI